MRKLISMILAVCLLAGVSISANAVDIESDEVPPENDTSAVEAVSNLDELQDAVTTAKNGDTIALGQTIYINGETVSTDKEITLIRADGFTSGNMLVIYNGVLDGFRFQESASAGIISIWPAQDSEITVKNCILNGGGVGEGIAIVGAGNQHQVTISRCEFSDCYHHSINVRANKNVNIEDCYIHDTYYDMGSSGAMHSSGNITLTRCTITGNTSWANAGVMCSGGTLVIDDCQIKGNKILSPESGVAVDIFCLDTVWSVLGDEDTANAGYFEITTGEKLDLPVKESTDFARLIFLTDEEAKDYFELPEDTGNDTTLPGEDGDDNETHAPAPDGDIDTPDDGNEDNGKPSENGNIPSDEVVDSGDNSGNENDGEAEEEQQPEVAPPSKDEDNVQPPEDEQPSESTVPPTDDSEDTSDSDQGGTEQPEKPVENESDSGDDYTPSRPHKPTQRPSEPSEDDVKPEMESPAPSLVCGEAVIDTSRSVVLAGYGDGDLHEDDPLTRAQLATIVCRLLDDESIEKLIIDKGKRFTDVTPDLWCYESVQIIARAGIVCGVGGGNYDPNGAVTWAQVLTVLSRFVVKEDFTLQNMTYDGWALQAVQTAAALGWIEDIATFDPDLVISRGELVSLVNGILGNYR